MIAQRGTSPHTIERRDAGLAVALALLVGALQWFAGRPPLCRCGIVALWTGTVNGPENSQQLADWYSLTHVVHGLIFYAALRWLLPRVRVGTRLVGAVAIEGLWELVENSPAVIDRYRAATLAVGYSGDSILNSVGDIGFMALGFVAASILPARWSIALALLLETVALAAIRDNLTLNVVMLLHPVAAIRAWQAG